uniref:hypothetical protein n=1 Tax=Klebsiella pneumoniae TaxID=573 RepID=UPI0018817516|nr:hypothetical protein [Klebsiella pneumoniae]
MLILQRWRANGALTVLILNAGRAAGRAAGANLINAGGKLWGCSGVHPQRWRAGKPGAGVHPQRWRE